MGEFLTYYLPATLLWVMPLAVLLAVGIWEDRR